MHCLIYPKTDLGSVEMRKLRERLVLVQGSRKESQNQNSSSQETKKYSCPSEILETVSFPALQWKKLDKHHVPRCPWAHGSAELSGQLTGPDSGERADIWTRTERSEWSRGDWWIELLAAKCSLGPRYRGSLGSPAGFSPCTSLGAPRKDWESPEKVSSLMETGRRESCHCSKGRKCRRLSFLSYGTVLVCERHSRSVARRALVKSQWMWGMEKERYLSPWCRTVAGWLRRVSPEAVQKHKAEASNWDGKACCGNKQTNKQTTLLFPSGISGRCWYTERNHSNRQAQTLH